MLLRAIDESCCVTEENRKSRITANRNRPMKKRTKKASIDGKIAVTENKTFPNEPKEIPKITKMLNEVFAKVPETAGKTSITPSGTYDSMMGTTVWKNPYIIVPTSRSEVVHSNNKKKNNHCYLDE